MKLSEYKFGDFVEQYSEKCGSPDLTAWDISGVNSDKEFFEPAKQVGADTSNYKIVPPYYFACTLMHVGIGRLWSWPMCWAMIWSGRNGGIEHGKSTIRDYAICKVQGTGNRQY